MWGSGNSSYASSSDGNHLTSKHESAGFKWKVGEHKFQTTSGPCL